MNVKKFFGILFIVTLVIFVGGFAVSHYEFLRAFKPFYYVLSFAVLLIVLVSGFYGLYKSIDEE